MLLEFEVWKEKKNELGIPYLYLLRSQNEKDLYCVLKIEDDIPVLLGTSFKKSNDQIKEEDWETLTDSRKNIEKFIINNIDSDVLVELENNFLKPDELNENKTILIDF